MKVLCIIVDVAILSVVPTSVCYVQIVLSQFWPLGIGGHSKMSPWVSGVSGTGILEQSVPKLRHKEIET